MAGPPSHPDRGGPPLQPRQYNAATTIQAFSTRLRDQLDLDTLSTELLTVVGQTMQPTRASLWLRPSPDDRSGTAHHEVRPTTRAD